MIQQKLNRTQEQVVNTKITKDLFGNISPNSINQFLIWYNENK